LVFARPIFTASVIQMSCIAVSHYNKWNCYLFTIWNTYSLHNGLWLWICSWAELLLSAVYSSYLSLLSMSSTLAVGGARNGIWPELLVCSRESLVLHHHHHQRISSRQSVLSSFINCHLCAGDLYTEAAEAATAAMKGRIASKYYVLADEAWAQLSDSWPGVTLTGGLQSVQLHCCSNLLHTEALLLAFAAGGLCIVLF